jgi:hypothetical protein
MGYFDPFLFQEPQYGEQGEPLDSNFAFPIPDSGIPLLNQDSNGIYPETESLPPQADDLERLPSSDESLRESQYYYTLIEQLNTQYYDDVIETTAIMEARLDDQQVKSQCELEKLRMLVAAKEREKKVESQAAQNAGSVPEP